MTRLASIATAPQLMELAKSAQPKNPAIMLPVVRPTPTMKLAHTAALEILPEYRPHTKGPRNEPARAPQLMPIIWAIQATLEWYW